MIRIYGKPLLQAVVSPEDYEYLATFRWHTAKGYVRRSVAGGFIYMAYEVMLRQGRLVPFGYEVDHINRNPLDNRRENLRILTRTENNNNRSCTLLSCI